MTLEIDVTSDVTSDNQLIWDVILTFANLYFRNMRVSQHLLAIKTYIGHISWLLHGHLSTHAFSMLVHTNIDAQSNFNSDSNI